MSSKSSTTDGSDSGTILVGLVHKPHGVRGEVAVEPLSDVATRFDVGAELGIAVPGVPRRRLRVRSARRHGRRLLLGFEGVDTRDHAEELRGGQLEIGREEVPELPEGEFYHFQLVGCRCFDTSGEELGVVADVLDDGGGQILRVLDDRGQLLVPLVRAYLVAVDVVRRRIELALPEGLAEACRSRS